MSITRKVKRLLGAKKYVHTDLKCMIDAENYSKLNPSERVYGVYLRDKILKGLGQLHHGTIDRSIKPGLGYYINGELTREDHGSNYTTVLDTIEFIPCKSREDAYELEQALQCHFEVLGRQFQTEFNGISSGEEWFDGFELGNTQEETRQMCINEVFSVAKTICNDELIGSILYTPEYYQEEAEKSIFEFWKILINKGHNYKKISKNKNVFYLLMKMRSGKNPTTLSSLYRIARDRWDNGISEPLVVDFLSYWPSAFSGLIEDAEKFNFEKNLIESGDFKRDDAFPSKFKTIDTGESDYEESFNEAVSSNEYSVIIRLSSMQSLSREVSDEYKNDEYREGGQITFDEVKFSFFNSFPAHISVTDEADYGRTKLRNSVLQGLPKYTMNISLSGSDLYAMRYLINDSNHYPYDVIKEAKDIAEGKLKRARNSARYHTVKRKLFELFDDMLEDEMNEVGVSRRIQQTVRANVDNQSQFKFSKKDNRYYTTDGKLVKFERRSEALALIRKSFLWDWSGTVYDETKPNDHKHLFWTWPNSGAKAAFYNEFQDGTLHDLFFEYEIIDLNHPRFSNPSTMERNVNVAVAKAEKNSKKTITLTLGKMLRGGKAPWTAVIRFDDFVNTRSSMQIDFRGQNGAFTDSGYFDVYDANIFRLSNTIAGIVEASSNGSNESEKWEVVQKLKLLPVYLASQFNTEILTVDDIKEYVDYNLEAKPFASLGYLREFPNDAFPDSLDSFSVDGTKANARDSKAGKAKDKKGKKPSNITNNTNNDDTKALERKKEILRNISNFLPVLILELEYDTIGKLIYDCSDELFEDWLYHIGLQVEVEDVDYWKNEIHGYFDVQKINRRISNFLSKYKKDGLGDKFYSTLSRKRKGDVNTDPILVKEMLNKLELYGDNIFSAPYKTFLDVSCGSSAEFAVQLRDRLIEAGCEEPQKYIFIWDDSPINRRMALKRLGSSFSTKNLFDFNTMNEKKKFDVVLGNPPYNDSDRSGNALWSIFIERANELIVENGYISFVVPGRWVLPGHNIKKGKKRIWDTIFINGTMYYINLGKCSDYFDNIGSDKDYFSYFIFGKKMYKEYMTTLETRNGIIEFDFNNTKWLPYKNSDDLSISIVNKVYKKTDDVFDLKWKFEQRDVKLLEVNNDDYNIKVFVGNSINGDTKFKFSNKKSTLHDDYKIIFKLGRFLNYNQRVFVDYSGNVSYNNAYVSIINFNENVDYLYSKLYRFLGSCLFNGSEITASGWRTLPRLDTSVKWTDAELYEYFGLTQEEIDYIEENVK